MEGREGQRQRPVGDRPSQARDVVRLFFALWPDEATRMALGRLASTLHEQCGGRQVRERNIHLTLVFLGSIPTRLVPAVVRMAGETPGEPVWLALDAIEHWRHRRIVCVGTSHCPAALRELYAGLARGASGLGIRTEARDYVPHITLLRNAARAPLQKQFHAIEWRVGEFALMQSLARCGGVTYEMVGRWALRARDAAATAGDQPGA